MNTTMRPLHMIAFWGFAACGGKFEPDLTDGSEGGSETETATDESTGDGSGTGDTSSTGETGETDSTTGETETETDTGGPVELEPNDPCNPLLEVEEIEICPDGHSCYLRSLQGGDKEFQCLPIVDEGGVYEGVEVGDLCNIGVGQHSPCYRSACGADGFASFGPPYVPTANWAEFCGPLQDDYCCTEWCDPNNPVQCDADWECYWAGNWFAPYGYCVPLP